MTLFDYLDAYVHAYVATGGLDDAPPEPPPSLDGSPGGLLSLAPGDAAMPAIGGEPAGDGPDPGVAAFEAVFGRLDAGPEPGLEAAPGAEVGVEPGGGGGSPADAWLSGHEWSGAAEIGGTSLTAGTVDTSGGGDSVYSVDGHVLDLPN